MEPPGFAMVCESSLEIFPCALLRPRNHLFPRLTAQLILWTQRLGDRCLIVERFGLQQELFQIRVTGLRDAGDFDMTEIAAFSFEKFAWIFHRRATRKTKRDMLLAKADVTERAVKLKHGNAPGIYSFRSSRNCLSYK